MAVGDAATVGTGAVAVSGRGVDVGDAASVGTVVGDAVAGAGPTDDGGASAITCGTGLATTAGSSVPQAASTNSAETMTVDDQTGLSVMGSIRLSMNITFGVLGRFATVDRGCQAVGGHNEGAAVRLPRTRAAQRL